MTGFCEAKVRVGTARPVRRWWPLMIVAWTRMGSFVRSGWILDIFKRLFKKLDKQNLLRK